jgi:type IV secretory pathway VirB10-like protein
MVRNPLERRERNRPGRFGLGWAIGISIVFHLLLILFSTWAPLDTRSAILESAEDSSLRFTFTPPVEQEQQGEKKGDVPLPQPDSPPVVAPLPQPEEQPSLALPPVLEQVTPQTQPLVEPELPQEEMPPPEDGTAEERVEQMTPENTLPAENDGMRRQEAPDNSQRQTRNDDAGGGMRAGLREFKRSVDRYQAQRREQEAMFFQVMRQ